MKLPGWLTGGEPAPAELTDQQLGMIATQLALMFPVWVRRRKTSMAFIDDSTIRSRQSIDFRFPPPEWFPESARPARGQTIMVPIWIGDKVPLAGFSLRDESGAALALLNANESAWLAAFGMSALVDGLAATQGDVGIASVSGVFDMLARLGRCTAADGDRIVKAALADGTALAGLLPERGVLRAYLFEIARGLLMLVPLRYEPGVDRLLKMEFHQPQSWSSVRGRTAGRHQMARLLTSMSLLDKRLRFERQQIGWARSTHFAFEPPSDVYLGRARLDAHQWDGGSEQMVDRKRHREEMARPIVDLHVSPDVTLRGLTADGQDALVTGPQVLPWRQDTASIELRLRAQPVSVLLPSALVSVVTAAMLWIFWWRFGALDGQTGAALLLLFPLSVAAYLARPGEHAFATRLLKGVRWLTFTVAVLALIVVALIAVGGADEGGVRSLSCQTVGLDAVSGPVSPPWMGIAQCAVGPGPSGPGGARVVALAAAALATVPGVVLLVAFLLTHIVSRGRRRKAARADAALPTVSGLGVLA